MTESDEKTAFFNERAGTWDETSRHDMAKVELMLQLLNIKKGERVLDVGTGTGVLLPLLARYTDEADITAIDIAAKMIEAAKRKAGDAKITFITGDVLEYPFDPERFDCIICYSVFPHFEDKRGTIRRLSRLLAPGGLLGILHSEPRDRINSIHIHARHHDIKADNLPPAEMVMDCMKDAGLREEIRIDNPDLYMLCARKRWRLPN
ncbi:MAG: methyltransferase domain-containing protein [Spirochaetaceae bacterium]|jgi:demethylmenaquinone methyltransferase/2-methoxy-6-polyprenyl-1,4-benzoquinol methylase|nr:methyltransferase domain-containing protein [Spirochaetaceae bacterium]